MGSGLVAPFFRAYHRLRGREPAQADAPRWLRDMLQRQGQQLGGILDWPHASADSAIGDLAIGDRGGIIRPSQHVPPDRRSLMACARAYRARSECALDVASTYPGGDYMEFGSTGLATFQSFLGAFWLHHDETNFPDAQFYAFDIFGDPDSGGRAPEGESAYFEGHRVERRYSAPMNAIAEYGPLAARTHIVPGYFQDTLTPELVARRRAEGRKVGYAFLDCSLGSSYKAVLDFLIEIMTPDGRMFIYLDEYFIDAKPSVHHLYQDFARQAKARYGLDSLYMRNAVGCGALFCLQPTRADA
jgi:hypothetical protein